MRCGPVSHAQEQTQMAMWAVFAAPLMMSNELRAGPGPVPSAPKKWRSPQ
jgi:hypothetical protein